MPLTMPPRPWQPMALLVSRKIRRPWCIVKNWPIAWAPESPNLQCDRSNSLNYFFFFNFIKAEENFYPAIKFNIVVEKVFLRGKVFADVLSRPNTHISKTHITHVVVIDDALHQCGQTGLIQVASGKGELVETLALSKTQAKTLAIVNRKSFIIK